MRWIAWYVKIQRFSLYYNDSSLVLHSGHMRCFLAGQLPPRYRLCPRRARDLWPPSPRKQLRKTRLWQIFFLRCTHASFHLSLFPSHTAQVTFLAFSPTGSHLFVDNEDNANVWEIPRQPMKIDTWPQTPLHSFGGHRNGRSGAAFTGDGAHLIVAKHESLIIRRVQNGAFLSILGVAKRWVCFNKIIFY